MNETHLLNQPTSKLISFYDKIHIHQVNPSPLISKTHGACVFGGSTVKYSIYIAFLFIALFLLAGCKQQAATPSQTSNKQSAVSSSSPSHGLIDINSASRQ